MKTTAALTLRDVTIAYADRMALARVSLEIGVGEFVGVVGPNGAGKSTLLNAIVGIVPLAQGNVRVHGQASTHTRARIAYMPQREAVDWSFPVTVEDVALMGRWPRAGWFKHFTAHDQRIAADALTQVGMSEYRHQPIGQLSGGQQQRVFLARALAQAGDVLLLDEPLTGVDATTQETILTLLQDLQQQGCTIVMTTHDLGVARAFCSQLLFLNRKVIAYGTPAETFTTEVLQQTYGGHILRAKDRTTSATLADALLILSDDTCHGCTDPLLDEVPLLPQRHA